MRATSAQSGFCFQEPLGPSSSHVLIQLLLQLHGTLFVDSLFPSGHTDCLDIEQFECMPKGANFEACLQELLEASSSHCLICLLLKLQETHNMSVAVERQGLSVM